MCTKRPARPLAVLMLWIAALTGCPAEGGPGLDEEFWSSSQPLIEGGSLKDTALYASDDEATMYQWAARTAPVLRVIPEHAVVRVGCPQPKQGYYQVIHAGTWGWIHGRELTERHGPVERLSATRLHALRLAQSAMGFSYWWSNARWDVTGPKFLPVDNTGNCDGLCPKCTHSGTGPTEYGADCSGFVSTIWGFPDDDPNTNPTNNGYSTKAYAKPNKQWFTIGLKEVITGDALVRDDDQRHHIVLVGTPVTEMGEMITYECAGCGSGCLTRKRPKRFYNRWTPIRRAGWPAY